MSKSHVRLRQRSLESTSVHVGTATAFGSDTVYNWPTIPASEICWDHRNPGPPYREGHMLKIMKGHLIDPLIQGSGLYETGSRKYVGGFVPLWPGNDPITSAEIAFVGTPLGSFPQSYGDPSDSDGAELWKRARPRQNLANIGVALGEIQETPRMLANSARSFADIWKGMGGHLKDFGPKKVANEWLNTQFGWIPFVKDVSDFLDTYDKVPRKLRHLKRDNGKWIKRVRRLQNNDSLTDLDSSWGSSGLVWPSLSTSFYRTVNGKRVHTVTHKEQLVSTWFEGRFRYYIPDLVERGGQTSLVNHIRQVLRVYGVRVSPSLLWNLTPWSWLADWSSNLGTVIDNLDGILYDNLTAKYAFVMRHSVLRITNISVIHLVGPKDVYCQWSKEIETKSRLPATPFGFGLDEDSFTPRQISILASLGLSRR